MTRCWSSFLMCVNNFVPSSYFWFIERQLLIHIAGLKPFSLRVSAATSVNQPMEPTAGHSMHVYKIRLRKDHRCSHDTAIRVYHAVGNVIETHEHAGDFKEW